MLIGKFQINSVHGDLEDRDRRARPRGYGVGHLLRPASTRAADKQLREAERIQRESQTFVQEQMRDDDLWSEKCVRAAQTLCAIGPRFIQGAGSKPGGHALVLLFPDYSLRNRIQSHLIEYKTPTSYIMRPLDVTQLRLKPMRDLIDLVLKRIEEFKKEDPDYATRMGL